MRASIIALVLTSASLVVRGQPASSAIAIRFCPGTAVRAYPLDDARGLKSVLLQNAAILQTGDQQTTVDEVDIQLLQSGQVADERRLTGDELRRFADAGRAMQGAGMLKLFSFQFCGTEMIPGAMNLGGPTLGQNEAMLILQQAFAFAGDRDSVRVRVHGQAAGRDIEAFQTLPIRSTLSTHAYQFPLRGTWYVASGPSFHTAHRWAVMEEFAFDLVKVNADGLTHQRTGARFEDYFAYGADVVAAGDGRVMATMNSRCTCI